MIQKVKIDVIAEFDDIAADAVDAIEKDVAFDYKEEAVPWYSGRQLLLLVLIGITALVFIVSILGTVVWMRDRKAKAEAKAKIEAEARIAKTASVVNLKDFMINIRDSKGNPRILVCDIALQFAPNRSRPDIEKRVDIRNIIYNLAKAKTADWWLSTEGSKNMKEEIGGRLNTLLGAGAVTEVLFTKLEVL
jgi:flagellar basal body-associated protein FliL